MSKIKKVEFERKKAHLRYDSDRKRWLGYQIDVQVGGKRYRNTFKTKVEAETFISELRHHKVYSNAGLPSDRVGIPRVSELFAERLKEIDEHKANIRAKRVFNYFSTLR